MGEKKRQFRQKPVIFLAFANDRLDQAAYLRNLSKELRGIRENLEEAKNANLCEVVERPNATVEDIITVFQNDAYNDRIAIFHYGGHANGYQLLLESLSGQQEAAYRESLAAFMSRQKGLKFVFLNGCSTQQHALELIQSGIPVVVGTSQSINDEVATELSICFYQGIANGASLEKAWLDAEDYIKIKKGTANFRELYWHGKQDTEDRFPWNIFYKKGAEKIKDWNLPEEAGNPLFGLPEIPRGKLPDKPFLFLNCYERKHAEIFFGRSSYIRELYDRVTDKKSPPLILLFGQSGVGKSSFLDAGLIPRLESSHIIYSAKRNLQRGLLGTLEDIFSQHFFVGKNKENSEYSRKENNNNGLTIADQWKHIEATNGKPLLIILDQVEEVFTCPNKELTDEWRNFLDALSGIFGNISDYPRGKLILGYRKEYHPEIVETIKNYELDRTDLFMEPLSREDIIDVVTGLTREKYVKDKYNIEVEDKLPVIIADDLLEDKNTPVAPVLQIILTKMWDTSQTDDFNPVHKFTVTQYQELRKQMLLLSDFFRQQLEKLKNWDETTVESGLVLDLLNYHTTELGTAYPRDIQDLRKTYRHRMDIIDELVQKLKDLYLLTDTQHKGETSLAHDTLAPVVIDIYNDSNMPAQRASRILAAKINEFKTNKNVTYLDEVDLDIVEAGEKWMRAWNRDEQLLVDKSRERKAQHKKEKKRIKIILNILVFITFIFAIFAAFQWKTAVNRSKRSEANRLAAEAERAVEKNPTIALRLAEMAYHIDINKIVIETLQKIYRENNFYKILLRQKDSISCVAFSPDGKYILNGFASEEKNAHLWNLQERQKIVLKGHDYSIISIAFSHDGKFLLTGSKDRTARLWDIRGTPLRVFTGHKDWIYSVAFSPDDRFILTGSRDKTACLWDIKGNLLNTFRGHEKDVLCAAFSPNGNHIITGSVDNTVRLWDLAGNKLQKMLRGHNGWVYSVAFSPDGKYILTGSRDKTACLWDLSGKKLQDFNGHNGFVNSAAFSPDSRYILTASSDNTARLWDLQGNQLQDFKGHESNVTSAVFSPDGQSILTGSWDKTIRIWSLHGTKFEILGSGRAAVNCAVQSPDKRYILTGLQDGTARLDDLRLNEFRIFQGHQGSITSVAFSSEDQYILTGSVDKTAVLWNFQGQRLQEFIGHIDRITSVAFSPDSSYILTASWDNTARLWDRQGKVIHELTGHKDDVNSAVFSPDGKTILTASWDHTVILWNTHGEMLNVIKCPGSLINCAVFSPDSQYILTGSNDGIDVTARLWNRQGDVLTVLTGHQYHISSLAFSPDGQYILTGSWDKSARLWDLQGNELQVFKGHERKINSVAFSPDGTRVLTGSADKTVRLWEIRMPLMHFLEKGLCHYWPEENGNEISNGEIK